MEWIEDKHRGRERERERRQKVVRKGTKIFTSKYSSIVFRLSISECSVLQNLLQVTTNLHVTEFIVLSFFHFAI